MNCVPLETDDDQHIAGDDAGWQVIDSIRPPISAAVNRASLLPAFPVAPLANSSRISLLIGAIESQPLSKERHLLIKAPA